MQSIIDRRGNRPVPDRCIFPVLDGSEDALRRKILRRNSTDERVVFPDFRGLIISPDCAHFSALQCTDAEVRFYFLSIYPNSFHLCTINVEQPARPAGNVQLLIV